MNTPAQNDPQTDVELRIRTIRTLWICFLLSIGAYFVFTIIAARNADVTPNPTLSLILICVAVPTIPVAFLIKNKLLSTAVEQRNVAMVQQGYIVSWAITEVAALLGVLDFFITGDRYYYVLLIIGALGLLLNFPRREAVENAAFNSSLV
jgi:hypothetical protein